MDAIEQFRSAIAAQQPLRLRGAGTKDFYGHTLEGELLDVSAHRGIVSYEPTELVVTARGGTPLAEIETVLAEHKQMLVFEPPFIAGGAKGSPNAVFAGSVPYLMLAGNVMAGWQLARSLIAAEEQLAAGNEPDFMRAKITTARFYADHILSRAPGVRDSIVEGAAGVTEMALDAF